MQLDFVKLIVDHLLEQGVVEAAPLYESPFTDVSPHGSDGLFKADVIEELVVTPESVRATSAAA